MSAYDANSLSDLEAVKQCFTEERNFYMKREDWNRVTQLKYKLKRVKDRISTLRSKRQYDE